MTWRGGDDPPAGRIGLAGWVRVARRGTVLALVTYGGLALLLALRLVERPLCGMNRPWTPHITQMVCRAALRILGLRLSARGKPMRKKGAAVANHASWLDIFTLNAAQRIYFVSKSEVARWPFIGWLARATGTVFINRRGREARAQKEIFEARLRQGHRLLFFPEGTSTDALRILPFKSTLFEAFFSENLKHVMHLQPVTVIYHAPPGEDPRFYGWWGDMDFGRHLLKVLAAPRQGRVEVVFHPPVAVEAFTGRKALSAHCERLVRVAFPRDRLPQDPGPASPACAAGLSRDH
ncbi:1-acyl-sn-glycerol-3-phosphate acyltransferase [Defluviimonas sp. 20V17]|uniref:1-acyl-sn-glycerol-3-phosphate acyltransferase n=1 Tax=Allgaiera indica TaxID=765699 RepID=A0AAN4UPS9_9RHOB|nr:lysophospholipid acyltransferase family protein [Allgaiera indica]KDB03338.1 1-acyl-sn-glycerol-3-phosphate acyltransferase [Defluviimonas sp. 20V17]GHE00452.1 1-acyl-sn-glycerol-3-phosphate acyltransferase [Allgaiera indica]SDW61711.1 lyso-ornithine lipid acyltransferase [Allgaiera indica]